MKFELLYLVVVLRAQPLALTLLTILHHMFKRILATTSCLVHTVKFCEKSKTKKQLPVSLVFFVSLSSKTDMLVVCELRHERNRGL